MSDSESYLELCIAALPPEKREAARVAFREIAETGEDSYLSKLLAVLEANNAYAKKIPREMAAVNEKFLADLAGAGDRLARQRAEADNLREVSLRQLIAGEVRVLNKTLPLEQAISAMQEQNRKLAQLENSIRQKRPVPLGSVIVFFIVGLVGGFIIGVALLAVGIEAELQEARRAKSFLDQVSAAGIELKLQPTDRGEMLTVAGPNVPGVSWHKTAAGDVTGVDLVYPEPTKR